MRIPGVHQRGGLSLQMTSMIDVVFLLLVFFLWTSSFQEPEFDLPTSLALEASAASASAGSQQPPPVEFDEIIIKVAADGILLNDRPQADLAELLRALQGIAEISTEGSVIVDPDDEVTMTRAIEVYDTARACGFAKVLFAAKAASAPQAP